MHNVLSILKKFKEKNILVVGDIMLDTYIKGDVSRISSEAPIPIVKVEQEFNLLGGAGNVAANIISLGGNASLFSFIGSDLNGEILRKLLQERQIEAYLQEEERTIQKMRIIGNNQQLARADFEIIKEKIFNKEIKEKMKKKAVESEVIIISDYAKGAITQNIMDFLSQFKEKIIVDPKPKNKSLYKGFFLIKPNEKEAFEMANVKDLELAGKKLREDLQTNVLVTKGKEGMTLFSDRTINIPTFAKEVYDVTGAGDTVIASIALSIASGASLSEAAIIGNHAAGIKVEKMGTYAVEASELMSKIIKEEQKILDLDRLKEIIFDLKKKGKKIVWTSGCFDLLHIGHIRYLKEAKKLGDILITGLNSDSSVQELKGMVRPIQTEQERAEILSSLEFVDYIIIFQEKSPEKCLRLLRPDVLVKGGDYDIMYLSNLEEGKIVKSYGGEIKIISQIQGKSTSNIIKNIKLRDAI